MENPQQENAPIEVTKRARRELARIVEKQPGAALRLFIEGYG